jgi:hypothetical protein
MLASETVDHNKIAVISRALSVLAITKSNG